MGKKKTSFGREVLSGTVSGTISGGIVLLVPSVVTALWAVLGPKLQIARDQVLVLLVIFVVSGIVSFLLFWLGRRSAASAKAPVESKPDTRDEEIRGLREQLREFKESYDGMVRANFAAMGEAQNEIKKLTTLSAGPVRSEDKPEVGVVATKLGQYDNELRKPGDLFTMPLEKGEALPTWARRANTMDLLWKLYYGGAIPVLPGMDQSDVVAVLARTEELLPSLDRAIEPCLFMLGRRLHEMKAEGESHASYLATFVNERVLQPARGARQSLQEVIDKKEDVRRALIGFYSCYQSARMWLIDIGRLRGWKFGEDGTYMAWCEADKEFQKELEKMVRRGSLKEVREHITQINADHKWSESYPV